MFVISFFSSFYLANKHLTTFQLGSCRVTFHSYFNFQQHFSYIVAVSSIGGVNWSTWSKPLNCRKSLTNFSHIMLYQLQLTMNGVQTHNFSGNRN